MSLVLVLLFLPGIPVRGNPVSDALSSKYIVTSPLAPGAKDTQPDPPRRSLFATRRDRPVVREIIIVDRTWSFMHDLPAAREAAWKHVNRVAATAQDAEVYVIGVGSAPGENGETSDEAAYVRGIRSRPEARREFDAAFAGPSSQEIDGGTDWRGAFARAAAYVGLKPMPAAVHLLVFGDLIADPRKDPATHHLLKAYGRVETYDFTPLNGLDSATFLYVDDDVRLALAQNASFNALGATILTAKEARARHGVIPPPPHPPRAGETADRNAPWALYGILGLAIIGLGVFLLRPAHNDSSRRVR